MIDNDNDFDRDRAIGIDGKPSELKSLIDNSSPLNEITREQYKFISSDGNYFILVDYVRDLDNVSYANWSLYNNPDDLINNDSSPPILTTRSLTKDFDDMILNENWEKRGNETVVCR
jgi:hypothetical protein